MLINTETKKYPLTAQQVREAFPTVTFAPQDWPPAPFAEVVPVAMPDFDSITQDCTEGQPEQVGGAWRQTWVVTDVAPEIAANRAAAAFEMSVPAEISYRQAKTFMELTPNAAHGNMWLAALAAAEAIPDPVQRVVVRNYIADSQVYERARVHGMCSMLGMTPAQADQMILAASKL